MIFLTGMPGSGKTYWGKLIAKEYELPWVDLDVLFERKHCTTVSQYFADYGQDAFREEENGILQESVTNNPSNTIVSCGGGIILKQDNKKLMKEYGCIIYLQTELAVLARRLEGNKSRPLLAGDADLLQTLADLYSKRKTFYEEADFILQTASLTLQDFRPIITGCIEQH